MKKHKIFLFFLIAVFILTIAACKTNTNRGIHLARVEKVEVKLLESFPMQAEVEISGNLGTPCYHIVDEATTIIKRGNHFIIGVYCDTNVPDDMLCAQVLVPFSLKLPLDILGLPAGEYKVTVNRVSTTFTLQVDNSIPDK